MPGSVTAAGDGASRESAWLSKVADLLADGPLALEQICAEIPKPSGTKSVKRLLESKTQRFRVVRDDRNATRFWVHIASTKECDDSEECESVETQGLTGLAKQDCFPHECLSWSASQLTQCLLKLVNEAEAAHLSLMARDNLVRKQIQHALRRKWRDACVTLFGSAASATRTNSSDIDLCVTIPDEYGSHWDPGERRPTSKKMIFTMAALLKSARGRAGSQVCGQVDPIVRARVPIVKAFHLEGQVTCDIVPHASLAVHNSALLRAYGELEPLCRQLVLTVKIWASRRALNSAMHHFLSSVRA